MGDLYDYNYKKKRYYNKNQQKNDLSKDLKTKLEISFIGAISKFEEHFGKLWGHGKEYSKLTDTEKKWRQIWNECRERILDQGNNQIRNMFKKLNQVYGGNYDNY